MVFGDTIDLRDLRTRLRWWNRAYTFLDAVWFSIDKDGLSESEALTNWDQGQMPLAAVKKVIETIGADICGECSPPRHSNWLKRWEAKTDQATRADDAVLCARNEHINRHLLATIEKAAR